MSPRKPKYTELTARVAALEGGLKTVRADMVALYNGAACHGIGWAISTGALLDFIRRLDALAPAQSAGVGSEPQRAAASGDSHAS